MQKFLNKATLPRRHTVHSMRKMWTIYVYIYFLQNVKHGNYVFNYIIRVISDVMCCYV